MCFAGDNGTGVRAATMMSGIHVALQVARSTKRPGMAAALECANQRVQVDVLSVSTEGSARSESLLGRAARKVAILRTNPMGNLHPDRSFDRPFDTGRPVSSRLKKKPTPIGQAWLRSACMPQAASAPSPEFAEGVFCL